MRRPGETKANQKTYLIYGRSGHGKTTFASSFPKPILLIDLQDEGDESVMDVEDLDVFEPKTIEELEAGYWFLKRNPKKYATVIIDTVTQLQAMGVKDIMANAKKPAKMKNKKLGDWGSMTKQQWGEVSNKLQRLIADFRGLPCHTVFLAQEKTIDPDEDNDDGVADVMMPEVGPAAMKSLASLVCSGSSFIGHTFIRNRTVKKGLKRTRKTEYCMRVGPNPVYITKVRKPKSIDVPDFIANPTYADIDKLKQGTYSNGTSQKSKGAKGRNRKSR